ncbi:hypothetical protein V6N13_002194 [Hibiscus sabdariffa]|uniref:Uncharacterized protein n=1 Tax=Hibiscus sabdariffa TaxID=183260 RepID=A0ABR2C240_9ROSI
MENSRWFNQAAGEMNNTNNTAGKNRVDLTLKLGMPSTAFHQNATLYHNTQQGGVNQGATVDGGQQSFIGSQTPFAWPSDQMGSSAGQQGATVDGGQQSFIGSQTPFAWPSNQMGSSAGLHNMNYVNGFNPFLGGPSLGFGSYGTTNPSSYNFAPPRPLPPPPQPPPVTGYTLLEVPARRVAANASGRVGNYNDPNRRCTNYNCKTNDTPMWRKGPLGPKLHQPTNGFSTSLSARASATLGEKKPATVPVPLPENHHLPLEI